MISFVNLKNCQWEFALTKDGNSMDSPSPRWGRGGVGVNACLFWDEVEMWM